MLFNINEVKKYNKEFKEKFEIEEDLNIREVNNNLWTYPDEKIANDNFREIILLVHGFNNTGYGTFSWGYIPQLVDDNFYPVAINLPNENTNDLYYSGKFILGSIFLLKKKYPDRKISIISHSMGNLTSSYALHYHPTFMSENIETYVGIGAPFNGVKQDLSDITSAEPSVFQAGHNSNFIKEINSTPFPNEIVYMSIISHTDEAILVDNKDPYKTIHFPKGTNGTSIYLQDFFKHDRPITHVEELGDNGAYEIAKATIKREKIDMSAGQKKYFPALEEEGMLWSIKYGTSISHAGDAIKISTEIIHNEKII